MKKLILFAAILFAGVSVVKAQKVATSSAKLNVILTPIQTITVNATTDVNLVYADADSYANGKDEATNKVMADHLSIVSTGKFHISVKASNLLPTEGSSGKVMPSSSIHIKAEEGSNSLTEAKYKDFNLATTDQTLITSSRGGVNKTFNVTYTGSIDDFYANDYIIGNEKTTYTTQVVYTLTPN